jgi:hypothetical protein
MASMMPNERKPLDGIDVAHTLDIRLLQWLNKGDGRQAASGLSYNYLTMSYIFPAKLQILHGCKCYAKRRCVFTEARAKSSISALENEGRFIVVAGIFNDIVQLPLWLA